MSFRLREWLRRLCCTITRQYNDSDEELRFHLAMAVIDRVPGLLDRAAHAKQPFRDRLIEHGLYVREHGEDMPEIRDWAWSCPVAEAS